MKEAIQAATDALLIAATAVVAVACFYTLSQPDVVPLPAAARNIEAGEIRMVVLHRSDCPDFYHRSFHFIIGNGVLYGDGEVIPTEAWKSGDPYPELHDRDARRHTVSVGLVLAGLHRPTDAQHAAVASLAASLGSGIRTVEHRVQQDEGCALEEPAYGAASRDAASSP